MRKACIFFNRDLWQMLTIMGFCIVVFWAVSLPSSAMGQVKSQLSIATDRIGSLYNSLGNGYSKVISQYSKMTVVVRPFTGPDSWIPSLDRGEIELGSVASSVIWYPYNAVGPPYSTPVTNFALLRSVKEAVFLGFVVTQKSGIKSIKDLKGKRVPAGLGGHVQTLRALTAGLRAGGLDWGDVVQVPVTDTVDLVRAFGDGRTDVAWAPVGQPAIREMDIKMGGVRYLPFGRDAETLAIIRRNLFPGIVIGVANKNLGPGVIEETPLMTYDSYLIAWAGLNDETVTTIISTLWDHTEELFSVHPGFKGFTRDAAVTSLPVIPYHPAAVRFYKEKGVWKEEANTIRK
jgi:hypothetical protein